MVSSAGNKALIGDGSTYICVCFCLFLFLPTRMRSFDVTLVSTFTQKNLSQTVNTYVLCMMEINFYGPIFLLCRVDTSMGPPNDILMYRYRRLMNYTGP